jgi:hypothetical protein
MVKAATAEQQAMPAARLRTDFFVFHGFWRDGVGGFRLGMKASTARLARVNKVVGLLMTDGYMCGCLSYGIESWRFGGSGVLP